MDGARYLARLMSASVHARDAATFARLVRDTAMLRGVIALADEARAAAYAPQPDEPASAVVDRLERGLYELAEKGGDGGGFRSFASALTSALEAADAAYRRPGGMSGLPTGLGDLDELLGGLHRSDLVVLAARPGMGKTALATNIAFQAARAHRTEPGEEGRPRTIAGAAVGFFSLEMSADQLVTRILAEQAGIAAERLRRGQLDQTEFGRVVEVASELDSLPFHIDETPALGIGQLRARARRLKRKHGLGLIVVDYLQLLASGRRQESRVQEISEITRGLKTLAKELDVPVLALSQLNRKVEEREDKRPLLADLRDSGTIEQDADVVMFVYRDEYYRRLQNKDVGDAAGWAEINVAKHRHGKVDKVTLCFDGPTTRFSDPPPQERKRAA